MALDAEAGMGMSLEDMIKANRKDKKASVSKASKKKVGGKKKDATGKKVGVKIGGKKKKGGNAAMTSVVTIKRKIGKKGGKIVATKVIKAKKSDKLIAAQAAKVRTNKRTLPSGLHSTRRMRWYIGVLVEWKTENDRRSTNLFSLCYVSVLFCNRMVWV